MRREMLFIVLWLSFQGGLPLYLKFDLPRFRYRNANFSWSMFGTIRKEFEVQLFVQGADGSRQKIPHVERYVAGYRSPEPMYAAEHYLCYEEIEERFAQLARFIAADRADDRVYGVAIEWLRPEPREPWLYTVSTP